MAVRVFTVEEAIRTLPLVQRVVAALVADYKTWRTSVAEFEWLAGMAPSESAEHQSMRDEIERLAARIDGYVAELTTIGCVCKDFDRGLVDFHGRYEGRDVFWCWKLGEPTVAHWHEVDGGFAGRQALPASVIGSGD